MPASVMRKLSEKELKYYYKASDILIVPSKWNEPFGRVIIEGQSNGCVVITSNVGAIPELIKHGKNGFIVKNGNFVELIKSLNSYSYPESTKNKLYEIKVIRPIRYTK